MTPNPRSWLLFKIHTPLIYSKKKGKLKNRALIFLALPAAKTPKFFENFKLIKSSNDEEKQIRLLISLLEELAHFFVLKSG